MRGDLRAGIIAATFANVNRDKKKKPTPFKATDFMPDFEGEYLAEEEMSEEEMIEFVKSMHERLSGAQKVGILG